MAPYKSCSRLVCVKTFLQRYIDLAMTLHASDWQDSNGQGTPNGRGKGKKAQTMSGAMDYRNESELSIEAQQQLVQQLLEGRGRTADPLPDWQVEWERLQALRSKQDASKSSSGSKSPAAHR